MTDDNVHMRSELVTLRDYVDTRIASITETMTATDKSMAIRLEAMNELRNQINCERGSYLLRSEHDAIHKSLDNDIRSLRESRAEIAGKASVTALYFTSLCVLISLILSVAALIRAFM